MRWDGRTLRRAIHNSTAERWEAAGPPAPASRPGEGEVIAHFDSGEPILRYSPAPPMVGTTGEIEARSLWTGQSVALAKHHSPLRKSWPNSSRACSFHFSGPRNWIAAIYYRYGVPSRTEPLG
jgi:hypothetical protein